LKLISSGTITIEMVRNAKGRIPILPKKINQATGKDSHQLTGFNEVSWGSHCSSYVKSAKKLSTRRFEEIISLATEYTKVSQNFEDDDAIEVLDDEDDIRANIIDLTSDSESNI
jgi:hypothetical protein